ncbi:MAG: c-type cytochrome [Caulobacter sp.]
MRFAAHLAVVSGTLILAAACGPAPKSSTESGPAATDAPAPAAAPAAAGPTDAEKAAILASLPAPYNTGDLENGRRQFALCRSCHTLPEGGPKLTGPNLHGVFGRKAGSVEGFAYSDAVKNAGFTWDAEKLDAWLADPRGFLPGNKMSFVGVKDAQKRIDLIAYLKVETGYKAGS